jgi:hypothetical protein
LRRYELPDVIDVVAQLQAEQRQLASNMQAGFAAINAKLDKLA